MHTLLVLHLLAPPAMGQPALTDTNIKAALTAWVSNPTTAVIKYGPIGDWNTAAVSNMASLFPEPVESGGVLHPITFNVDISKWNVGKVTNMNRLFHHPL